MVRDAERRLLPTALAALLAALTLLLGVAGASSTTLAGSASGASVHTEAGGATTGAATSTNGGRLAVRERLAAASRVHRGHSSSPAAHALPRAGAVTAAGGAKAGAAAAPHAAAPLALVLLGVAVATPAARPTIGREGVPSGRGPPSASGV